MRNIKYLALFLVLTMFAHGDENASPSRAQALVDISKKLVVEMSRYGKEGDTQLKEILKTSKWDGEIDWDAATKDQKALEQKLQVIALQLLGLKETNVNAKAVVEKFQIKQN